MRPVMRDEALEKQFQEEGYVEIPFISPKEVEDLKRNFFELITQSGGNLGPADNGMPGCEISYDFTFIDKNIAYKQAVFDVITEYFKPHVQKWLADYRPIIANYIRKKTDTGEVPLHQNWAFVDEWKYTSVSIWCPLVDSSKANGTLEVVPRSHKRFGEFRGPMVSWELEGIKNEIINNYLIPLNVKAGNAIILDDSIVHYSALNQTDELRLAIQLILVPEEAPSIHYHMNTKESMSKIEVLEVDTDFYMQFNPWKDAKEAKRIRSFDYTPSQLTVDQFLQKMARKRIDEKSANNLLEKVKAIFTN